MKTIMILTIALMISSCTKENKLGKCVGVNQKYLMQDNLVYEANIANIMLGVVFFEVIFPPYFVLKDEFYCPVANKK